MICQTFIPDIWHIADKYDFIESHLFSSSHLIIGTGDGNAQNFNSWEQNITAILYCVFCICPVLHQTPNHVVKYNI